MNFPYENGPEFAPKPEYAPTKIGHIGAFSSLIECESAPYQQVGDQVLDDKRLLNVKRLSFDERLLLLI